MNCQENPSQHCRIEDRDLGHSRGTWACLLRILGSFALLMNLFGCASQALLTANERDAVYTGDKALVLLRVQCTVDNQPYEPFETTFTVEPIVFFGLGTLETVGEPRVVGNRFISKESRRAGWTYFVLAPGVYYLAVIGPEGSAIYKAGAGKYLQEAPRWRIDVPENAKLIYAGTLQLTGKSDGSLLFGGKVITPINSDEFTLRDDHELARSLLSEHFPDAGETQTILMQRWHRGDPVIIRSQKRSQTK
jgi:hypothetical protein